MKTVLSFVLSVALTTISLRVLSADLPAGYSAVSAVWSDGEAYVDTGYKPNGQTRIETEIVIRAGGSGCFFGADDRSVKDASYFSLNPDGQSGFYAHIPGSDYYHQTKPSASADSYEAFRVLSENGVMSIENMATGESSVCDKSGNWVAKGFGSYQYSNTFYLFACHGDNSGPDAVREVCSSCRIRRFRIYEGDVLVRDLVPVQRDGDGVVGFYDLAEHPDGSDGSRFHVPPCGALRTEFGLEGGRYRLSYIESTGRQDIDTGYVFKDTPKIEARFLSLETGETDYFGMPSAADDCIIITHDDTNARGKLYYRYSSSKSYTVSYAADLQSDWSDWVYGTNVFCNGTKLKYEGTSYDFSANKQTFHLFRARKFARFRLASIRMWDGETLVFDAFPAVSNGVVGVWDRVRRGFLKNDGAGEFAYGETVPTQPGDFVDDETVYYVDGNSSDAKDDVAYGSARFPWKTLAYAVGQAAAGSRIVVKAGWQTVEDPIGIDKALTVSGEDGGTYLTASDGGLVIQMTADGAVLTNLTFTGCRMAIDQSAGLLTHCWVTNNVVSDDAGLVLSGGVVENCAFLDNRTDGGTDGDSAIIFVGGGVLRNNTVANNRSEAWAVRCASGAKVFNNIIWGNGSRQDASVDRNWSVVSGGSTANMRNNCTTRIADISGAGNIESDPVFVGGVPPKTKGWSPCRNAGDKALGTDSARDIFGGSRLQGGEIDIGCFEWPGQHGCLILFF